MNLEETLKQTRPFRSIYEKTSLNIIFTGNWLQSRLEECVKSHGLTTHQQYNILRILRGVHPEGHSIQDIKCRMLDRNSDVSRLVDRLLKQGLVTREEDAQNRRKVIVKITDIGLKLLEDLQPLIDEMNRFFAQIPEEQLDQVNTVLDQIRTIQECTERPQCGENT